jgi:hypothetical protein
MTKKPASPVVGGKSARPSDLLDRTRRLATTPVHTTQAEHMAPPSGEEKKTRLSVDLDDAQYEYLSIYAVKQKVRKVNVLRSLLQLMAEDDSIADQVGRRLKGRIE